MSFSAKEAPEEITDERTPFSMARGFAAYCQSSAFDQSDGPMLALKFEELAQSVSAHDALVNALIFLMEVTEPPEKNCSCHLNPPCGDCTEYGTVRDAHAQAQTALKLALGVKP